MRLQNNIIRRTLLAGLAVGGTIAVADSPALASAPKTLEVAPGPSVSKPQLSPAATPKVTPLDLAAIKPLTPVQVVHQVAAQGIKIQPAELQSPVDLTPRQLWHNSRTYMSVVSGAVMPGFNPPRMSLRAGGEHGAGAYLEIKLAMAKNTTYIVDCRVSNRETFYFKDGTSTYQTLPGNGHVVYAMRPRSTDGDATIYISSDGAWTSSGCSITPAR